MPWGNPHKLSLHNICISQSQIYCMINSWIHHNCKHKLLLYKWKPYTAQIKEQSTMRMVDRLLEKVARFSPVLSRGLVTHKRSTQWLKMLLSTQLYKWGSRKWMPSSFILLRSKWDYRWPHHYPWDIANLPFPPSGGFAGTNSVPVLLACRYPGMTGYG